jgi:hypothetical protein
VLVFFDRFVNPASSLRLEGNGARGTFGNAFPLTKKMLVSFQTKEKEAPFSGENRRRENSPSDTGANR